MSDILTCVNISTHYLSTLNIVTKNNDKNNKKELFKFLVLLVCVCVI